MSYEDHKKIRDAVALSMLDAAAPSKETLNLMEQYVEGNITYDSMLSKVIKKYSQKH
ncbi:MAG: antitoxin VbhA family protein [Clostridiaceae bacterium]|nr:antitoxin VbhA family protein [Clostridiaceae bacterium]